MLEQYQAQVTSAMRPAFDASTPPDVTAIAVKVIASWICSGVNRKIGDLKRVKTLLVDRLETIKSAPDPAYNERATTMLRIALLTSWGRIAAAGKEKGGFEYLTEIVAPVAGALTGHWQDALRDYALMSLPPEYRNQVPGQGAFYYPGTTVAALVYFQEAFPVLLQAAAMYTDCSDEAGHTNFYLLLGLCTRTLCGRATEEQATACLRSLKHVVGQSTRLSGDGQLFTELCKVLNHTAYTSGMAAKQGVIEVLEACATGKCAISDADVKVGGGSAVTEALEVMIGVVLRECPGLVDGSSPPATPAAAQLAVCGIASICALPALCTVDAGRVAVGQAAMVLLINALKTGDPALGAEAIKGLKTVLGAGGAGSEYAADSPWAALVLSGLQAVVDQLDASSTSGASKEQLLLALAIFLVTAGEEVRHATLEARITSMLRQMIDDASSQRVQLKATQVLATLAQLPGAKKDVYVRSVAPHAIALLSAAAAQKPQAADELPVLAEAIKLLSVLAAQSTEDGRPKVIAMVVALCVALLEVDLSACGAVRLQLHQLALATLNQIGPMYPAPFRTVITGAPALAQRMAAAVRASAALATAANGPALAAAAAARRAAELAAAAPKIQLTMDFGGF